ncbi:hypothetical protein GIB67_034059 [Kingdonia uniflora]|uniref:Methyltransferase-like protein 13 n=1 Tax=Kingdonia uniflora TaxID=39325 RepID=A0A7J7M6D0_9MAGN|nr:hypothetical protein GIB67_034059 [Kingdonia uniflora]
MAINKSTFETLTPSQFITFTIPNPNPTSPNLLRVAVLDSPSQPSKPQVAAMVVPKHRENDWIFSTETGHLQLLVNIPEISRLILVGDLPLSNNNDGTPVMYNRPLLADDDITYETSLEVSLTPLLIVLSPKSCVVDNVLPEIPFVSYEDNVISSVVVEVCDSSNVGEMLVENIEIESDDKGVREFRRRLRFKRMPNLVQTEIRIVPVTGKSFFNAGMNEMAFRVDMGCLVHPYLSPMVAGFSLIAPYLEECVCKGSVPRVLCVGVGGGALLTFLQTQLGFQVVGVESDETVLRVAKQYFGLVESDLLRVYVGDGIEVLEKSSGKGSGDVVNDNNVDVFDGLFARADVIMVDLDSSDAKNGIGAPPLEFVRKPVLVAAKLALHERGMLVINVIPPNTDFYYRIISEFREVFTELYEINVENGENYVLIATVSPIDVVANDIENSILKKLKLIIPKQCMDDIKKI